MLPAAARMRRRPEFAAVIRRGRRASTPAVTIHLLAHPDGGSPTRVGFVVSRAVGPAVVRNQVRRRLRHVMRDRLSRLPGSTQVVVRATPTAAALDSAALAAAVDAALRRALERPRERDRP